MSNKVAGTTVVLMFILLGLLGLGNLGIAFDDSIASYGFWFHIVIGMLLLFIAWSLYRVMGNYERTIDKHLNALHGLGYRDLDDYIEQQEEKRNKREEEELDEDEQEAVKQKVYANMSRDELAVLREEYKSNSGVVEIISKAIYANLMREANEINKDSARILVVDDDERYLMLVYGILSAQEYRVATSVDGYDALEKIKTNRYDLLITGIRMPMSGFILIKQACRIAPQLKEKTIVISGSVDDEDTRQFLAENKLPYLPKPFEIKQLMKLVNQVLSRIDE